MGERMCRSSHLLLPSSIPSLSWSREGMKRIVKRRKDFNGSEKRAVARARCQKFVPRQQFPDFVAIKPFLPPSPFSQPPLFNLLNNWERTIEERHLEREKGIMNFCLLPSSYYFGLFKISSSISVCNSFSNKSGVFCSWNFLIIRRGVKLQQGIVVIARVEVKNFFSLPSKFIYYQSSRFPRIPGSDLNSKEN